MGISIGVMGKNDDLFKHFAHKIDSFLDAISHQTLAAKSFQIGIQEKASKILLPEKLTSLQLHSLRRYAAHLEINGSPPLLPMKDIDKKPLIEQIRNGDITLEEFQKTLMSPEISKAHFLSDRNYYSGDPVLEKIYRDSLPLKKYIHLIGDSDYANGYFFPIDFPKPISINKDSRQEQTILGSSQRLLIELDEINAYLRLPSTLKLGTSAFSKLLENDSWNYEKEAWMIFYWCAKESISQNLIMYFG
jgi:hypothetical protein